MKIQEVTLRAIDKRTTRLHEKLFEGRDELRTQDRKFLMLWSSSFLPS